MNPKIIGQSIIDNMTKGRWAFITIEDGIQVLRQWIRRFPVRYDLIVGVPRAGMFFASMMSNNLGVPLSSPDLLPEIWGASNLPSRPIRNILIVEDSTTRGTYLLPARDKALKLFPEATVHIGSLFINDMTIPLDTHGDKLPKRGLFEWDLLHLDRELKVGTDMDGVLCVNPPRLKESEFSAWASTANPFLIPVYGVHVIITSRNEAYRELTVDWLKRNQVMFRTLLMDPTPIGMKKDDFQFKCRAINFSRPKLFLESGDHLAWRLHWSTGVPTLAIDTMRFFGGEHGTI